MLYVWVVGGFLGFFVLEQFMHWHHCHRAVARHGPLGHLILVTDGLHNLVSALNFLVGGWMAFALSGAFEVTWLLPFAAGNFIHIAAADLLPGLTRHPEAGRKLLLTSMFSPGLALLLLVAMLV